MKRLPVIIALALALAACGATEPAAPTSTTAPPTPSATETPPTWLTLDGYDPDAQITIQSINLWKDYNNRGAGVAATGRHGQKVKLIRRSGDGVLIELPNNGGRGWVTYYFIKEYK